LINVHGIEIMSKLLLIVYSGIKCNKTLQ